MFYRFIILIENSGWDEIYYLCQRFKTDFIIVAVPSKPPPPDATDIFSDRATLTWQPPSNDGGTAITGYHLERSTNNSGRWVRITREPLKLLTYDALSLMEDTNYEWRVVAVNARGESEPSEPCEFVAKDPWGK